jgi:hypothetical protein
MSKFLENVIAPMDIIARIAFEGLHQQLFDSILDPKVIRGAKG